MKHFVHRMPSPRLPAFLIEWRLRGSDNPPRRCAVREYRRERWHDWQEANGRAFGGTGSHRDLQFAYFHSAQTERRRANYLIARLHLSISREERLRAYVNSLSPMKLIEMGRTA